MFHSRPTSDVVGVNRKALIRRRHDVLLPSGNDLNAVHKVLTKTKREKRKTKKARFKLFSC